MTVVVSYAAFRLKVATVKQCFRSFPRSNQNLVKLAENNCKQFASTSAVRRPLLVAFSLFVDPRKSTFTCLVKARCFLWSSSRSSANPITAKSAPGQPSNGMLHACTRQNKLCPICPHCSGTKTKDLFRGCFLVSSRRSTYTQFWLILLCRSRSTARWNLLCHAEPARLRCVPLVNLPTESSPAPEGWRQIYAL